MPISTTSYHAAASLSTTTILLPTSPFITDEASDMEAAAPFWSYEASGSEVHKPILAQRFRTKQCDKFATTGSCPYVHRCMFAHGEDELRTAAQNVADGLVSEEAIRAFKRYHFEAEKLRVGRNFRNQHYHGHQYQRAAFYDDEDEQYGSHNYDRHHLRLVAYADSSSSHYQYHYQHRHSYPQYQHAAFDEVESAHGPLFAGDSSSSTGSQTPPPPSHSSVASSPAVTSRAARRHDPYATKSAWHPLGLTPSTVVMLSCSPLASYAKAL